MSIFIYLFYCYKFSKYIKHYVYKLLYTHNKKYKFDTTYISILYKRKQINLSAVHMANNTSKTVIFNCIFIFCKCLTT